MHQPTSARTRLSHACINQRVPAQDSHIRASTNECPHKTLTCMHQPTSAHTRLSHTCINQRVPAQDSHMHASTNECLHKTLTCMHQPTSACTRLSHACINQRVPAQDSHIHASTSGNWYLYMERVGLVFNRSFVPKQRFCHLGALYTASVCIDGIG